MNNLKMRFLVAATLLGSMVPGVVGAADQSIPWSDLNSDFAVEDDSYCSTVSALSFGEEEDYSFDGGGLATVNGTSIGPGSPTVDVSFSGSYSDVRFPNTGVQTVGDLGVTLSYRFTSDNIVRTIVSVTNNGASDATGVSIKVINDYGDDFPIYHVDGGAWRSSGDWFVMSDTDSTDPTETNYAPVFNMPDGPGSPESVASIADCNGDPRNLTTPGDEYMVFGYSVNIPAGETRRIMVVQGVDRVGKTVASAIVKAQTFNPASLDPGVGILDDVLLDVGCTIVNWDFESCSSGGDGGGSGPVFEYSLDPYLEAASLPDTL